MDEIWGYPVPAVAVVGTVAASIIAATTAMASVWITHRLTQKRNLNEKLWALRREAMSRILADLMWIQRKADEWKREQAFLVKISPYAHAVDIETQLNERTAQLVETFESNYLNLSRTFYALRDDLGIFTHAELFKPKPDRVTFANGIRSIRAGAIAIARREMPPPAPEFDFRFFAKKVGKFVARVYLKGWFDRNS